MGVRRVGIPTRGSSPANRGKLIWSGTISPATLAHFETLTGIKLRVSYAVSNEDIETRLMTGHSGFDVVGAAADYLQRELQAGAYLPLDKSKLPHLANMDPELMRKVAIHDPDNAHATILMWGTDGIGYNDKMVKRLMPNAPVDSWRLIFDPTVASTLSKCGIGVVDSAVDLMRAVLPYLGRDPNSQRPEDLAAAEATLMKVRPCISHIDSVGYVQALANGELCVALGYSGDVAQARDRAREANTGIDINYVIPKEGSIMWFMLLAIPDHASNVDGALPTWPHCIYKSPPSETIQRHTPRRRYVRACLFHCRIHPSSCVPLRGCGKNSRRASNAWIATYNRRAPRGR
jgi:putrescine transport system substrate-binding protein